MTTEATASSGTTWRGWYRANRRQRWRQLSQADDYGRALNALLDAAAKLPGHGELLVSQTNPNQDRRRP